MPMVNMIFQNSMDDCGHACIAMLLNYYGKKVSLHQIKMTQHTSSKILTAQDMCHLALSYGVKLKVVFSYDFVAILSKEPCILHWENRHYVVAHLSKNDTVKVYDPAEGIRIISKHVLKDYITGFVLEVDSIAPIDRLSIRQRYKQHVDKFKRYLTAFFPLISLLVLSQILVFRSPFLIQRLIDVVRHYNHFQLPLY